VELEVLGLPHADDGLDGLLRLGPALLAVDAERGLLHRRRPAGAPLDPAAGQHVGRGHLLGDPDGRAEAVRHQGHAEPEPDLLGDLGQGADQDLGGRAVRAPLPEVVLDVPGRVEAEPVGKADLLQRLAVRPLLGLALTPRVAASPGFGHIDLVQQVQLHRSPSFEMANYVLNHEQFRHDP
jgi:hypothetical protein